MSTPPLSILTPVFPRNEPHPAFFLDRDDTLIPDVPYLHDPEKVELLPNAIPGLTALRNAGFRLILLSNQSGIGRGRFTEQELFAVHQRLQELLAQDGVFLDAAYFCPHQPSDGCACRKPATGLLDAALEDFDILLAESAMAGDKPADILLGKAKGIPAIQTLRPGREAIPEADYTASDLRNAAEWLLARRECRK